LNSVTPLFYATYLRIRKRASRRATPWRPFEEVLCHSTKYPKRGGTAPFDTVVCDDAADIELKHSTFAMRHDQKMLSNMIQRGSDEKTRPFEVKQLFFSLSTAARAKRGPHLAAGINSLISAPRSVSLYPLSCNYLQTYVFIGFTLNKYFILL